MHIALWQILIVNYSHSARQDATASCKVTSPSFQLPTKSSATRALFSETSSKHRTVKAGHIKAEGQCYDEDHALCQLHAKLAHLCHRATVYTCTSTLSGPVCMYAVKHEHRLYDTALIYQRCEGCIGPAATCETDLEQLQAYWSTSGHCH